MWRDNGLRVGDQFFPVLIPLSTSLSIPSSWGLSYSCPSLPRYKPYWVAFMPDFPYCPECVFTDASIRLSGMGPALLALVIDIRRLGRPSCELEQSSNKLSVGEGRGKSLTHWERQSLQGSDTSLLRQLSPLPQRVFETTVVERIIINDQFHS